MALSCYDVAVQQSVIPDGGSAVRTKSCPNKRLDSDDVARGVIPLRCRRIV
jgi:hypothetical protein